MAGLRNMRIAVVRRTDDERPLFETEEIATVELETGSNSMDSTVFGVG